MWGSSQVSDVAAPLVRPDRDGVVRYKWLAEHRLDPTRIIPDLDELRAATERELGPTDDETVGLDAPAEDSAG